MDDNKLRALLTAVQCGSFGKAAAQLGYTQSAMTHLVSKLEAELGCTLLLRSSKGVRLSEEGSICCPIFRTSSTPAALRQEAEGQGRVYGRALRIGCFASIARARLPELLRKFRKQHPEIKVDVLVQGNELADALEEDRIQLAIVDEACARGFQWTPLTDALLVAVTPPDFPGRRIPSPGPAAAGAVPLQPGAVCGAVPAPGGAAPGGHRLRRRGDPVHGGGGAGRVGAVRVFRWRATRTASRSSL